MLIIEVHNEDPSVLPIDGGTLTFGGNYQYLAFIAGEKLEWAVFNGQVVGDDFVIEGEVLSLAEVRKRNLKPRYFKND